MLKARSIGFNAFGNRALLEDRKTQTRRIIKNQAMLDHIEWCAGGADDEPSAKEALGQRIENPANKNFDSGIRLWCAEYPEEGSLLFDIPYGMPGDLLFVEEIPDLILEITNIRIERICDISDTDAKAEGCQEGWLNNAMPEKDLGNGYTISSPGTFASNIGKFYMLWESIYGEDSIEANPWVWVIEFKVHKCNIENFRNKEGGLYGKIQNKCTAHA